MLLVVLCAATSADVGGPGAAHVQRERSSPGEESSLSMSSCARAHTAAEPSVMPAAPPPPGCACIAAFAAVGPLAPGSAEPPMMA
jgi:hypothetical protein